MKKQEIGKFSERVQALETAFYLINEKLYAPLNKKIILPCFITIQSRGKHAAYGWCYQVPNWKNAIGQSIAYEINIAAETLDRPLEDTFITLAHEMVHLYNIQNQIKDVSSTSGRHNRRFAEGCKLIGLACVAHSKLGQTTQRPITESSRAFRNVFLEFEKTGLGDLLTVARKEVPSKQKVKSSRSNQIKYICPCCGVSVRATRPVSIKCADCNEIMEKE